MQLKHDIGIEVSSEESKNEKKTSENENKHITIIIGLVAIAVLSLALFFFIASQAQQKIDSYYAVVFSKSDGDYFSSSKGGFELNNSAGKKTVITKDSKKLLYFTASGGATGNKFDLHCCDLTSKLQIKKGGFVVDTGIGGDIKVNEMGSYLIYSKKNDSTGEVTFYLYDLKKKKSIKFENNIKEIFLLSSEEGVYYTKIKDSQIALYKYIFYSEPQLIAESVKKVSFFTKNGKDALLIETFEEEAVLFGLSVIDGLEDIKVISSGVTQVLYEKFVPGGNLYFFKSNPANTSWEEVITDDLKEQDEQITQPNADNYPFIFGYSYQYRKDIAAYQEKANRDELRASINRTIALDNLMSKGMDCFAYNSAGAVKVAESATPERIFAVSSVAEPAVVFEKYDYKKSEITFSKLAKMLGSNDMAYVTDYAVNAVKTATASQGIHIAFTGDKAGGQSLNITGEEAQGCVFGFSTDSKSLFVVMKDAKVFESTFFKYDNNNGTLSKREVIDVNISSFDFAGDFIWYHKTEKDANEGTLYLYSNGTKKQVIGSVFSFICFENGETLIFRNKKQNQSGLSADMYIYSEESCVLINENVDLHNLRYKSAKELVYIKNFDDAIGGDLYVYANGKSALAAQGANGILLF